MRLCDAPYLPAPGNVVRPQRSPGTCSPAPHPMRRAAGRKLTLPTKVPSDNLGQIGGLKRISDNSPFPMALGSCGHRITHQLRPINMNGRSTLSETSKLGSFSGSIPHSFVLSPNLPMINTTSNWLRFGTFLRGPEGSTRRCAESTSRLPGDGYGCHAHAQSEHGEPWRDTIRGVSSAGMTSAALHARENASMPPRERHGRLDPISKTGISITASTISSHSLATTS